MDIAIRVLAVIVVAALVAGLLVWRWSSSKAAVAEYVAENGLDLEIVGVRMIPLRLWLKNRRNDSWIKVQSPLGEASYARVRNGLSGRSVELFS